MVQTTSPQNQRLIDVLEEEKVDAIIAFSADNVAYTAGYSVPSQELRMRNREFATLVTANGESALLLTSNEEPEAQTRSSVQQLYPYDEFNDDPMVLLKAMLEAHGLERAKVAIELDAITASRWTDLEPQTKGVHWVEAANIFHRARMIKTAPEIASLRQAAKIAAESQISSYTSFKPGITEKDAYRLISDEAIGRGADQVLMIQVAAGDRSTFSNPTPSDVTFQPRDAVKLDVFLTVDGYVSDTGRSIFVEEMTARQKDIWNYGNDILQFLISNIKPGRTTGELWRLFMSELEKRKMSPAMRFLGHGLGLSLHEEPFIAAHADTVLEPGMVFAIEPVLEEAGVGYHIEDILLITDDGAQNFTPYYDRQPTIIPA